MAGIRKQLNKLGGLLFFVGIISLAILLGRTTGDALPNQNDSNPLDTNLRIIDTTPPASTASSSPATETILIVTEERGITQLIRIDPAAGSRQIVFTDSDESLKIKQVGTTNAKGDEVLVVMGPTDREFGGSLWVIATDGSGKKTQLLEEFASPWPPALSPDGKKIAYVFFSNAENESGFSLIVANRDGTNKRELVRETQSITQPIFNVNGTIIAYLRGSSVVTITIGGGVAKELHNFGNRTPYDLAWSASDDFAFIDGTNNAASLYLLRAGQTEPEKISLTGQMSRPIFSQDSHHLTFARLENDVVSIVDMEIETNASRIIENGLFPLAWINGGDE